MTLKLDLGCGPNPKEGFIGLDQYTFDKEGVYQTDLSAGVFVIHGPAVLGDVKLNPRMGGGYTLPDSCVDEASCTHFLEHLEFGTGTRHTRVKFINELFRILKPEANVSVVTPHWASTRAWGDPTHAPYPVAEMFHYYLSAEWRASQAPHSDIKYNKESGYSCDFSCTWGYTMKEELQAKNQEQQMFALANYKEAVLDMVASWVAKKAALTPLETVDVMAARINPKRRGRPPKGK